MYSYFKTVTEAYDVFTITPLSFPNLCSAVGILEYITLACAMLFFFLFFLCLLGYYATEHATPTYYTSSFYVSHRSVQQDLLFSSIPALIIFFLIFPSISALYNNIPNDTFIWLDAEQLDVTGYQWNWLPFSKEARGRRSHPIFFFYEYDATLLSEYIAERLLTTTNTLTFIQPAMLCVTVAGGEVIHSFEVRPLFIKLDAVPGYVQHFVFPVVLSFDARGHCTEFCGIGHSFMPLNVSVIPDEVVQALHAHILALEQERFGRLVIGAAFTLWLEFIRHVEPAINLLGKRFYYCMLGAAVRYAVTGDAFAACLVIFLLVVMYFFLLFIILEPYFVKKYGARYYYVYGIVAAVLLVLAVISGCSIIACYFFFYTQFAFFKTLFLVYSCSTLFALFSATLSQSAVLKKLARYNCIVLGVVVLFSGVVVLCTSVLPALSSLYDFLHDRLFPAPPTLVPPVPVTPDPCTPEPGTPAPGTPATPTEGTPEPHVWTEREIWVWSIILGIQIGIVLDMVLFSIDRYIVAFIKW